MSESLRSNQGQESVESKPISGITPENVATAINEMQETHEGILSNEQEQMIVSETKATQGALEKFQGKTKRVITLGLVGLSLLAASPTWAEGAESDVTRYAIEMLKKRQGNTEGKTPLILSPAKPPTETGKRAGPILSPPNSFLQKNIGGKAPAQEVSRVTEDLRRSREKLEKATQEYHRAVEEMMRRMKGGR